MLLEPTESQRQRVLWLATISFTLMFAVWLMFGMLSVKFRQELGLSDGQLYNLTLVAILAGSVLRFNFGIWTDKYGGRVMLPLLMSLVIIPTFLVSQATEYWHLLVLAGFFGLAGNSFSIGIAWCAAWFPKERQGLALGIFGAGNVGASVTKLFGPMLIALVPATGFLDGAIAGGWRFIPVVYAVLLSVMALTVFLLAPKVDRTPARGKSFGELLQPIGKLRAWEFSLHYVVVFGAYVALSNLLPNYYMNNYGQELAGELGLNEKLVTEYKAITSLKGTAAADYMKANPEVKTDLDYITKWVGFLAAFCYIFPASLLRPLGGWLSDKFGPKVVMTCVFWAMLAAGVFLTFLPTVSVWLFTAALFILGVGMGVGKASVYKMIPDTFPNEIGAVGGLVGLLGALGGVLLPLLAAPLQASLGRPSVLFGVLLGLTVISTVWFYLTQFTTKRKTASVTVAAEKPVLTTAS
jgi:MFS transporter, NNP family, nitrate/nitrite transporter